MPDKDMRKNRAVSFVVLASLCIFAQPTALLAYASNCGDATKNYNSAIDEISYSLKRYTNCLNASSGNDDCSSEFRRLRNAQDEFESAVSDIRNYCTRRY